MCGSVDVVGCVCLFCLWVLMQVCVCVDVGVGVIIARVFVGFC